MVGPHGGRGLRKRCYDRLLREEHPDRTQWRRTELIAELALLAEAGVFAVDVPAKLGVQWDTVVVAHRREGVPLPVRYRFRTGDLRGIPLV